MTSFSSFFSEAQCSSFARAEVRLRVQWPAGAAASISEDGSTASLYIKGPRVTFPVAASTSRQLPDVPETATRSTRASSVQLCSVSRSLLSQTSGRRPSASLHAALASSSTETPPFVCFSTTATRTPRRAEIDAQRDAGVEGIRRRHRREQDCCREKTHSTSALVLHCCCAVAHG